MGMGDDPSVRKLPSAGQVAKGAALLTGSHRGASSRERVAAMIGDGAWRVSPIRLDPAEGSPARILSVSVLAISRTSFSLSPAITRRLPIASFGLLRTARIGPTPDGI